MESPATDENTRMGVENHQVNEELLLKQITELVINQRLLSGKTNAEDRVVNFVHPEDLKVYSNFKMFIFLIYWISIFLLLLFIFTEVGRSLARWQAFESRSNFGTV
jgi:hypothetical protein